MSADTIAHLKITLDDVEPTVLRRVDVPFDIRLDRLHLTIQAAMGWTNSHLYELRAGDVGWSTPYPDADWSGDFLDARKARLNDILEDRRRLRLRNRRLVDVVIEFASVSEGRERESGDIEVGRVGPDRVLPRFRWR